MYMSIGDRVSCSPGWSQTSWRYPKTFSPPYLFLPNALQLWAVPPLLFLWSAGDRTQNWASTYQLTTTPELFFFFLRWVLRTSWIIYFWIFPFGIFRLWLTQGWGGGDPLHENQLQTASYLSSACPPSSSGTLAPYIWAATWCLRLSVQGDSANVCGSSTKCVLLDHEV